MNLYSVLLDTMGAAAFTVAASELLLYLRIRAPNRHFSMSTGVTSLFTAGYCLACAGEYNVAAAVQSVPWLRAQSVFLNLMGLSYLWFVSDMTHAVPKSHFRAIAGWFILSSIAELIGFGTLSWDPSKPLITVVNLPFGVQVVYREVMAGTLTNIEWTAGALVFVYVFVLLIRYYRAGHKRDGRYLLAVAIILLVAIGNDFAVSSGFYSFIYLTEYAWLAAVIYVGFQRSNQIAESARIKDALAESEEKLRTLIEQSSEAIILTSESGRIIEFNHAAETLTGVQASRALGQRVVDIVNLLCQLAGDQDSPADGALFREIIRAVDEDAAERRVEGELRRPDGTVRFFRQDIFPIWTKDGYRLGSIAHDITELRKSNEKLLASLEEKNILIKEIHHRVKNNLQIVSSLLDMQKGDVIDPTKSRTIIEDARNRIRSMALIHEDLYGSVDFQRVRFDNYIRQLVERLYVLSSYDHNISLLFDLDESFLTMDQAIPCGLVLNELCTNAMKYAFPPEINVADPEIKVAFHEANGMVDLSVSDNGIGLPDGFDFRNTQSLGMQIITTLEQQLNGQISVNSGPGTSIHVKFRRSGHLLGTRLS